MAFKPVVIGKPVIFAVGFTCSKLREVGYVPYKDVSIYKVSEVIPEVTRALLLPVGVMEIDTVLSTTCPLIAATSSSSSNGLHHSRIMFLNTDPASGSLA